MVEHSLGRAVTEAVIFGSGGQERGQTPETRSLGRIDPRAPSPTASALTTTNAARFLAIFIIRSRCPWCGELRLSGAGKVEACRVKPDTRIKEPR